MESTISNNATLKEVEELELENSLIHQKLLKNKQVLKEMREAAVEASSELILTDINLN